MCDINRGYFIRNCSKEACMSDFEQDQRLLLSDLYRIYKIENGQEKEICLAVWRVQVKKHFSSYSLNYQQVMADQKAKLEQESDKRRNPVLYQIIE